MPVIKFKGNKIKEETKEEILEKIKILLDLINEEPLKDYTKYHPSKTPNKYKKNKFAYSSRNTSKPNTKKKHELSLDQNNLNNIKNYKSFKKKTQQNGFYSATNGNKINYNNTGL